MTKIYSSVRFPGIKVEHLRQYFFEGGFARERIISPSNRNGHTVYECLACHEVEGTNKRFNDGPTTAQKRIRAWVKVHRAESRKVWDSR